MHMTDRGEEVVRPVDPNAVGGANVMGTSQAAAAAAAIGAKNPFARAAAELARESSFSGSGSEAKGVGSGASAGAAEDDEDDDDDDSDPPPPPGTESISGAVADQSILPTPKMAIIIVSIDCWNSNQIGLLVSCDVWCCESPYLHPPFRL